MSKRRKNRGEEKKTDRLSIILSLFREFPDTKYTLKHLASASGGNDRQGRRETEAIVRELLEQNVIEHATLTKYRLNPRNGPTYRGRFGITAGGSFVLRSDELTGPVTVRPENAGHALDGDEVEFTVVMNRRRTAFEAMVTGVTQRSERTYIGVAEAGPHHIFVHATSARLPVEIFLPRKGNESVEQGDKVAVRIVDWPETSKSPLGRLVENFGPAGDNDAEMHAILSEFDLPARFDPDVEAAAEALAGPIGGEELARRRDFRAVTTFTIDPADAKDFDDALSIRSVGEGLWEIGVHIADVTHYVREGSVIDREAEERGTSVYLVDRTVPMLPERLCNELCSLRPDEDSLCFSAVFTLNEKAEVTAQWFGRTVIHSDHRFDYASAQQILTSSEGPYAEELQTLDRLAKLLRKERFRHGSIAFERDEMKFELDEKGRPIGVMQKQSLDTNRLIEEFMLLANRRVAEFCAKGDADGRKRRGRKNERPMVFRVHDEPATDKIERFRTFVSRFGHRFTAAGGRSVAKEMNRLLGKIRNTPQANAVTMMAVKSMAKACYTTDNIGHYGLAFSYYTHFTSPIRRYPDMMVHRLLAHYLAGGTTADREELELRCRHASEREILASDAERASVRYKMVEFMADKIGRTFTGTVSGLAEWGFFVELDETKVEGTVYLRDVGEYLQLDRERYELVGLRSGHRLTLGDPVRVRVKSADLQRRQLVFEAMDFPSWRRHGSADSDGEYYDE